MTELTQQRKEWSATYLLNVLKAICREAYACHFQQGERDSDPCGQCANCKADKMLGANWRTVEAGRSSLESENAELLEACKWMSKACGLSAQLHAALKALIPSPGSLSPEKHALWQEVINVIYASADFAETRESVKLLREGKF